MTHNTCFAAVVRAGPVQQPLATVKLSALESERIQICIYVILRQQYAIAYTAMNNLTPACTCMHVGTHPAQNTLRAYFCRALIFYSLK